MRKLFLLALFSISNTQFLHSISQRTGIDPKNSRRPIRAVHLALCLREYVLDMAGNDRIQIKRFFCRRQGCRVRPRSSWMHMLKSQWSCWIKDHCPLHNIAQFPDITGPAIFQQKINCSRKNSGDSRQVKLLGLLADKMLKQGRDILFSGPKRWDMNRKDIETEPEVFPKFTLPDHLF